MMMATANGDNGLCYDDSNVDNAEDENDDVDDDGASANGDNG